MSIFSKLKEYGGSWEVTNTDRISKAEAAEIKSAKVVTKEFEWGIGTSICFFMKNGRTKFAPLSNQSDLEEGDDVDPKSVVFLTLSKDGEDDIYRADGKPLANPDDDEEEEEEEEVKPKKVRKVK